MSWLEVGKQFLKIVETFFVLYLVGYSTFLFFAVFTGSSALYQRRRMERLQNVLHQEYYVPLSILIPAHNEAVTIVSSVLSLLEQDYPLYEIVVIDDGSTDDTAQRLIEAFEMHRIERPVRRVIPCRPEESIYEARHRKAHITLIRKGNSGKADSLNMGINVCRYPYFICLDADSMLQRDSLREIVRPVLEDDRTIACGGQVRPSNGVRMEHGNVTRYRLPHNPVACMQVLEYDRSFLASRILMDQFNGNLIISGAFGLFQKEMVMLAGGYDASTMGEDMELVVKLHVFCRVNNIDYSMRYVPEAVCWSQVPGNLWDLARQRRRWHIGLFESLTKYRRAMAGKGYGFSGVMAMLYYWLYELLSPYIEIFGLTTIALSYFLNLVNPTFMVLFFCAYALYGCTLTLIAFFSRIHTQHLRISFLDGVKAVLMSFLELMGLRFFLMLVRGNALLGYRKKRSEWGKLERSKQDWH